MIKKGGTPWNPAVMAVYRVEVANVSGTGCFGW